MKKVRYVIDIQGSPRTIFSITEKNDGSLLLTVPGGSKAYSASTLAEMIAISDQTLLENCHKHISIHPSPISPTLTSIKRTIEYQERPENNQETSHHYSTGIKQDNQFIPVLFRICGDLSAQRYLVAPKDSDQIISLGAFDPSKSQLKLMVVCSGIDKSFPQDPEQPRNRREDKFNHFTLTLIWSYLGQPSHPQAIDFFLQTKDRNTPMRGLVWQEIYNLYNDLDLTHALQYLKELNIE
ncbi:hypothetical protein [Polynucleobacter sp.]|uniref:hypothetical protein n=1 Tax=Polynucleobacter sp. TaxID=2029855 RepID=UPI003F6A312C